ncbi:MAG: hypothetical protein GF405_07340 [Candidatus Eisenbacteria bacterium]|nr:hypothetical protein [Candidatus Eisenbacteria bacterium]
MRAAALAVPIVLALALQGCVPAGRLSDETTAEKGPVPGEACVVIATDGAWSWFGGPRAVSVGGENPRTYVGWVTSGGDIRVGAFDHETGSVETALLHDDFQADDHANPTLLVDEEERLMAFYSGHRGRWTIYRQTLRPHDLEDWTRERAAGPFTNDVRGYTYPSPVQLESRGDSVLVFWRGPGYDAAFAASGDDRHWTPGRTVLEGAGQLYFRVASDTAGAVHVAFNDGHPRTTSDNGVSYVRLHNGVFERADGTPVAGLDELPVDPSRADRVYDGSGPDGRSWLWDVAADAAGRPVIVYAVFPSEDDHRYRYARWNGTSWDDHEITPAGRWFPDVPETSSRFEPYYSGGLCLDHGDPSVVYLSRPVDGVFEIERWTTEDGGATWESTAVTAGSAMDNVRPVVPRNARPDGPRVIWMHGEYSDYLDYRTDLRAR